MLPPADADLEIPTLSTLTRRVAYLEHQNRTLLFLSASNLIANVGTLVLWGLLSLA